MSKRPCPFDDRQRQMKIRVRETDINKNSAENMQNIYGKKYNCFILLTTSTEQMFILW